MGAKQSKRRGLLKEDLDYLLGKISISTSKQGHKIGFAQEKYFMSLCCTKDPWSRVLIISGVLTTIID